MSIDFIRKAGCNFANCLSNAGKDVKRFSESLINLAKYHACGIHQWKDGQCDFDPLKYCTCGNCNSDDIKCNSRPYQSKHILSCQFHSIAYEVECHKRASKAESLIHPLLGKGNTNQVEASHNVLCAF